MCRRCDNQRRPGIGVTGHHDAPAPDENEREDSDEFGGEMPDGISHVAGSGNWLNAAAKLDAKPDRRNSERIGVRPEIGNADSESRLRVRTPSTDSEY